MSTESLRHELIEWIGRLNDADLLRSLLGIKHAVDRTDWAEDLSEEERRSIERGLADLEAGRSASGRAFWSRHGR
ncbi:MAG: hypothetical protein KDB77_09665 [Flavobacteriales bacterium]|nr:hypothetical protein [Flavobacteriales bacterium]HPJ52467.1 hypothetical protein [Flavobacteriales bacterium]